VPIILVMSRIDELSVKLDSLQAEHKHLINEHWVPLQQFASGVMASLSVLTSTDPSTAFPLFCSKCGRGNAPAQPQGKDGLGCVTPIPIGLVSSDLQAFGIHPSNPPWSPLFPPSLISSPPPQARNPFYVPPHLHPIPSLVIILPLLIIGQIIY